MQYSTRINGISRLVVTKLDVLDDFATLKICTGYRMLDGTVITDPMPDTPQLLHASPIYEEWEGWQASTPECRHWDDLPKQARASLHTSLITTRGRRAGE